MDPEQLSASKRTTALSGGRLTSLKVPAVEVDSTRSLSLSHRDRKFYAGMPAWRAGIRSEMVVAVDSVAVSDWYAMREKIVGSPRPV